MPVSSRQATTVLERAASWFTRSGIQNANGGVARYYRTDARENARVSTEITGYAVSTHVYLYNTTGDREFLRAAEMSARFLIRDAFQSGIFPFEYDEHAEPLAYFFDSGIIARGLLALWRITGDDEYLAGAHEAGLSMLLDFGAGPHPVLQLPSKQPLPYENRWSRQPGCYQLKSALAWLELGFADAFERVLAKALESHATFLPGPDPEKTMDRLHAYCYFLEALLQVPGHAAVVTDGIDTVSKYLRELRHVFVRSDVYAQLLRIRLWAEAAGVPLDRPAASEEADAIPTFQADNGGFWFGSKAGEFLPFLNPVSTAFCLQAWEMWQDRQSGVLSPGSHPLI